MVNIVQIKKLTFSDHSRIFHNFKYIYPVVSRRANGVSLGINLNTNNACNWRCIYCQVEGLVRGKPEEVDLIKLEYELDYMLNWLIDLDFIQEYAPEGLKRLNDICLSGNGESTLSKQFLSVIKIIAQMRLKYHLTKDVKTILITNGSEIDKVIDGIKLIAANNGEIWFKIDSVTSDGLNAINQVNLDLSGMIKRLELAARLCPTFIQTCIFKQSSLLPKSSEIEAYLKVINQLKDKIQGVLLYSTARNPALPEGANISSVSADYLADLARRIEEIGVAVKFYV